MIVSDNRICFRVDASARIGTGHFMRCLALAQELVDVGANVQFVSRHLPPNLREMLLARGIESVVLATRSAGSTGGDLTHSEWLGVTQEQDAQDTMMTLSGSPCPWIIVDHYALDYRWECLMRDAGRKILVIDDLADRGHDCDVLVDQNHYDDMAERYRDKVPSPCTLLLGPRYAILRREFGVARESTSPRDGRIRRVLVFFGGIDAGNCTVPALHALAAAGIENLAVDVVVGAGAAHRAEVEAISAQHGFRCHVQTSRMADLMAQADLAIGAGGTATWERCCVGLPALAICTAANQKRQVEDAASLGLLIMLESAADLQEMLTLQLRALRQSGGLLRFVSRNSMQQVDARGTSRIVARLGLSRIEVRRAGENDSLRLFEWRNDPTVRSVSRNPGLINLEHHRKWFAQVTSDPQRLLLIGERAGLPIGVVRFDCRGEHAEVSLYLAPDAQKRGHGAGLLSSAENWISTHRPEIRNIHATVLAGNLPSERLFYRCGYRAGSTEFLKQLDHAY